MKIFNKLIIIVLPIKTTNLTHYPNLNCFEKPRPPLSIFSFEFVSIVNSFKLLISVAQFQLGDSFRLGLPSKSDSQFELINIGIYKYMRNPILFGWLILLLATFFIIPNFISIIVIIVNYIFINIEIREEELYLYHRFNEKYVKYYEKAGRFFPYFKKQKFTATELYKYIHNII